MNINQEYLEPLIYKKHIKKDFISNSSIFHSTLKLLFQKKEDSLLCSQFQKLNKNNQTKIIAWLQKNFSTTSSIIKQIIHYLQEYSLCSKNCTIINDHILFHFRFYDLFNCETFVKAFKIKK